METAIWVVILILALIALLEAIWMDGARTFAPPNRYNLGGVNSGEDFWLILLLLLVIAYFLL